MSTRYVYRFGGGQADGDASMKALLGGKGANLAEMARMGLPVPPGFTVTTEACRQALAQDGDVPDDVRAEVEQAIRALAESQGKSWGGGDAPVLLVSVRSGAAVSMPGMMDTVLDVGLNEVTVQRLAAESGDEHFAWDSYRRLLHMYGDVVMGVERGPFETLIEAAREREGVALDSELSVAGLKALAASYRAYILDAAGEPVPDDPTAQLLGAVRAVFKSWNSPRAVTYRNSQGIPKDAGTAVNVQTMVYGNLGDNSGTGVAFTRDPATGENRFYGEWLRNAQGEDVVAGIRTPRPLRTRQSSGVDDESSLEASMPAMFDQLMGVRAKLEARYREMQDIEFTIERGTLYMLQTRTGKRSPGAAVRIAVEMVGEGLITRDEGILRVPPSAVEALLHPRLAPGVRYEVIAEGLGASPGAASGEIRFTASDAEEAAAQGREVILVRPETSPEDIHGILAAQGILTARGGMTSHAAVVARGLGKPCVAGCEALHIDVEAGTMLVGSTTFRAGDIITLDGASGLVIPGEVPTVPAAIDEWLETVLGWADEVRRLRVFANADNPTDAQVARDLGAEGIGLCRTEHMFFDPERLPVVRRMILASDKSEELAALREIRPMQQQDFEGLFRVMDGYPVIIRLLDPPLHEFLPHDAEETAALAAQLGMDVDHLRERCEELREVNPMLGHRGCRLGLTHPAIYRTQVEAIHGAAEAVRAEGVRIHPEIMVPLVGYVGELAAVRDQVVETIGAAVPVKVGDAEETEPSYRLGTMIELPRAALAAGELAQVAEFFSFGTNDLTQCTLGLSRDDSGRFLPSFVEAGMLPHDPFVSIDERVAELVALAFERGRATRPGMSIGICGEHGGDPKSVMRCHDIGLDYVSCSPYRVPVARLAAAQAVLRAKKAA